MILGWLLIFITQKLSIYLIKYFLNLSLYAMLF